MIKIIRQPFSYLDLTQELNQKLARKQLLGECRALALLILIDLEITKQKLEKWKHQHGICETHVFTANR